MPIFAPGNKNFSVYFRTGWPVWTHCDLFVVGANGTISRWNEQSVRGDPGPFEGWISFPTMAVNADESAIIACLVPDGLEGGQLDSFISAVKGF
jgi:hypothetical protein